jgi:prepilin peptidase CpaA
LRFVDVFALATVVVGTGVAAVIDLRTRRVPNGLTAAMTVAGIALALAGAGRVSVGAACVGCVLGAALMLPGHVLGATGAGDVKLLGAVGASLGPVLTLRAFVATVLAGGVIALAVAIRRGRLGQTLAATTKLATRGETGEIEASTADNRFAYAPAIAIGATLVALGW